MNKAFSVNREKLNKKSSTDANVTDDTLSNRKCISSHKKNLSSFHVRDNYPQHKAGIPLLKESRNSVVDGSQLDTNYIEDLVNKVKDLQSRMLYFEKQCPETSNTFLNYHDRDQSTGDCGFTDFKNRKTTKSYNASDNSIYQSKCNSDVRSYLEHQKSIYTTNEPNIKSLYSPNCYFQDPKNKSNKTNVSIVMSLHSSKKEITSDCKTTKPNPRKFKAAAEEFIKQAEDLKAKIGYILDCCGYNTPGSEYTVSSVTSYSSKKGFSKRSSKKGSSTDVDAKQLKYIDKQYQEILKTLLSIDQNIKKFGKAQLVASKSKKNSSGTSIASNPESYTLKKNRKKMQGSGSKSSISRKSSKISSKQMQNKCQKECKNKKGNNLEGCDRESCKSLQNLNKKGKVLSKTKMRRSTSSEAKKNTKDKSKKLGKSKRNDRLEPIVMVYEPIEPHSSNSKNCTRCGKQSQPCKTKCRSRPSDDNKKSEKHGFVVTYTPKIKSDSSSTSTSRRKSGKTPCCFGF